MFKNILNKKESQLYLGTVTVVPRADFKRFFEQREAFASEDLDLEILLTLKEIFDIPILSNATIHPAKHNIGLDIIVTKFQFGGTFEIVNGIIPLMLFWRPKIAIASRLFLIKNGKTISTLTVSNAISWREYFSRIFTLRAFLRLKPIFNAKDMDILLKKACFKMLTKLKNKI